MQAEPYAALFVLFMVLNPNLQPGFPLSISGEKSLQAPSDRDVLLGELAIHLVPLTRRAGKGWSESTSCSQAKSCQ